MNKVICDVCGTAYPETSAHCPICGCAKAAADHTAAGDEEGTYASVKGGRFSKKNVRMRSTGAPQERAGAPAKRQQEHPEPQEKRERNQNDRQERRPRAQQEPEEQSNTGLILIVIFLLIAIVAVVIYIGMRVFAPPKDDGAGQSTVQTNEPTSDGEDTDPQTVPCQDLQVLPFVELQAKGDTYALQVQLIPESTTDTVTFNSKDPSIVTVDAQGNLKAVGSGTTLIEIKCGAVTKTCTVQCSFTDTEEPTDPPAGPEQPEFVFEFNTKFKDGDKWDITLKYGDVWTCYKKDLAVDPGAITWSSENPAVCTIQNGIVTIMGPGTTQIHAQYGGKTFTCIVRTDKKSFPSTEDTEQPDTDEEPDENAPAFSINKTDVSITVGETFTLVLKDASGNAVDVTWSAENATYVTIDGNKITGAAPGTTNVSVTHEGQTYTCIVRVR